MKALIITCLVLIHAVPGIAQAQSRGGGAGGSGPFYFEETFFPVYVNRTDTRSVTEAPGVAPETGLGFDFRTTLGWAFWNQMLVGFTYNMYTLNTKRAAVSGGDSGLNESTSRSEFGPTLGYLNGGWRVLFTYFISGQSEVATKNHDDTGTVGDVTIKNSEMTGFQFTAGYSFNVLDNLQIGPTLVYRSVSYKKQSKVNALNSIENYTDAPLYTKYQDSTLNPMLSIVVRF